MRLPPHAADVPSPPETVGRSEWSDDRFENEVTEAQTESDEEADGGGSGRGGVGGVGGRVFALQGDEEIAWTRELEEFRTENHLKKPKRAPAINKRPVNAFSLFCEMTTRCIPALHVQSSLFIEGTCKKTCKVGRRAV